MEKTTSMGWNINGVKCPDTADMKSNKKLQNVAAMTWTQFTIGIIVGEQLDVILLRKVFHLLRNSATSRQIHLIYTRLHLTDTHRDLLLFCSIFTKTLLVHYIHPSICTSGKDSNSNPKEDPKIQDPIFTNPESRHWWHPNPRISGLQKLVRIVLCRMLNDRTQTFHER